MNFSVSGNGGGLLEIILAFAVGMIVLVVLITALRWWANGGKDEPADAAIDRDENNAIM